MPQFAAGERITASKLSTTRLQVACDSALVVTTTTTDVPGMTITIVTTRDNVSCEALGTLDIQAVGADPLTGTVVGQLDIDGVKPTNQIIWDAGTNSTTTDGARNQPSQSWVFVLASAGSHTIKIMANRVAGTAGDAQVQAIHSTLRLVVEDHV